MARRINILPSLAAITAAALVLFAASRPCQGQKHSRHPGLKFSPPGSRSLACPAGVRCSALYCAVQCGVSGAARCRSFSYSRTDGACLLTERAFSSSSPFSVQDSRWSAYRQREFGYKYRQREFGYKYKQREFGYKQREFGYKYKQREFGYKQRPSLKTLSAIGTLISSFVQAA